MAKSGRTAKPGSLTGLQIGAFSLVMWPLCVGQMPLSYMAPYFAQQLGLDLTVIGLLLTIARLLDVVFDFSVAYLSDSLANRFGRRRPWIVVGLPLFAFAGWLLFIPYPSMTMIRYGFGLLFFFLFWTVAFIPYLSQGTELSTDPQERNRINITQSYVMLSGLLLSFLLPLLIVDRRTFGLRQAIGDYLAGLHLSVLDGLVGALHTAPLTGVASYGGTMLVIVAATCLVTPFALAGYVLFVPDRSAAATQAKGSMKDAFRNRLFLRFCAGYLMIMVGYSGRSFFFPFILSAWFNRADLILVLLLTQYVTSVVITPLWSQAFKRFERRTCVALAAGLEALALLFMAVLPSGAHSLLIFAFVLVGLPGQTLLMAPFLIAADSADYAKWKYRTESRAVHVSIVSVLVKLGFAASALSIWVAGAIGFNPRLHDQPPRMLAMLKAIGFYAPMLLLLAGAAIVMTYPLTRQRQAAIQRRLDVRARDQAAAWRAKDLANPADFAVAPI